VDQLLVGSHEVDVDAVTGKPPQTQESLDRGDAAATDHNSEIAHVASA